jgi:hypothetical protein
VPDVTELLPLIVLLAEREVDFVLIGGAAGVVHGSSYPTYDVDVAYARDRLNLERLAATLKSVDATLRGAPKDIPFILDAETLEKAGNFTFDTKLGSLDLLAYPTESPPYERLREEASVINLGGHDVRVASLDHLIRMKEAAGRAKDKLMASEYRVLADERR